jgi:hypothetical protein
MHSVMYILFANDNICILQSHELSSIGGYLHYYAGDWGSNPGHLTYSP